MEKFQTFWRGKVFLFCASFLALMVLVFVACRQDMKLEQPYLNQAESTKLLSAKIQKAKFWFDDELSKTKAEFGADQMIRGKVEPLWEQAKVVGSSVEVPFFVDRQMLFPTLQQGLARFGISRLVISPKGRSFKGNIFVLYPSANFKGDMKTLQAAAFQEQKFDGIIRVLNFKGEKVEAVWVSNGKIAKKLREHIVDRDGIAPRETCYDVITYGCGAVCVGGVCGEVTCSTKTIAYECGDIDSGGGGGGNGDCAGTECECYPWIPGCNDGGGGGDTGCTDPDPCVCNPNGPDCACKCKATYSECSNFTELTWGRFEISPDYPGAGEYTVCSAKFSLSIAVGDCPKQVFSDPGLCGYFYAH